MREIYVCTKHIGFTYKDTMLMPVWERRNYLDQLVNEVDYQNKQAESQNKSSGGGGNRRRSL